MDRVRLLILGTIGLCLALTAASAEDAPFAHEPKRAGQSPAPGFREPLRPVDPAGWNNVLPEPAAVVTPALIPLTRSAKSGSAAQTADGKPVARSSGASIGTILTSLGFVVLLMLGLAKIFGRANPFQVPGIPREAIDVLGRRTVDPRSSIYVVRVGAKILLLGSATNGLTTLAEITDPIEVATLANLCHPVEPPRANVSDWVRGLFGLKVEHDTRSFGERFGESVSQDGQRKAGQPSSHGTVRNPQEGRHVA